jgi:hypothetical protein
VVERSGETLWVHRAKGRDLGEEHRSAFVAVPVQKGSLSHISEDETDVLGSRQDAAAVSLHFRRG